MNPEPKRAAPFLEIRGVSKRYDATQALRSVDFFVESGEVHAVVGENGAGKSTLVKIVTGAVQADAGRILLEGMPTLIASPLASQRLGIRVVHQHVSLVPHLTVSENMLLGDIPAGTFGWYIDWRAAHARASGILHDLGFGGIDVRQAVSRLSLAQRSRSRSRRPVPSSRACSSWMSPRPPFRMRSARACSA